MGLRKVYQNIFNHLNNTIGPAGTNQIKHVDLFNSQFTHEEQGTGQTYGSPAVFISFPEETPWESNQKGIDYGNLVIDIYVSQMSAETTPLDFFDLVDSVHFQMQGFTDPDSNTEPGTLQRLTSGRVEDHTQRLIWRFKYVAPFLDNSGFEDKDKDTIDGNTITLTLDCDLKIDNLALNIGKID